MPTDNERILGVVLYIAAFAIMMAIVLPLIAYVEDRRLERLKREKAANGASSTESPSS